MSVLIPGSRYHEKLQELAGLPRLEAMFSGNDFKFELQRFMAGHLVLSGIPTSCYDCLGRIRGDTLQISTIDTEISESSYNFHPACYEGLVMRGVQ